MPLRLASIFERRAWLRDDVSAEMAYFKEQRIDQVMERWLSNPRVTFYPYGTSRCDPAAAISPRAGAADGPFEGRIFDYTKVPSHLCLGSAPALAHSAPPFYKRRSPSAPLTPLSPFRGGSSLRRFRAFSGAGTDGGALCPFLCLVLWLFRSPSSLSLTLPRVWSSSVPPWQGHGHARPRQARLRR